MAERQACMKGKSGQDLNTCLKEAEAARAEARQSTGSGKDSASAQDLKSNRLARCEKLPDRDREECRKRISDGKRSGNVDSGGIGYELTTRKIDTSATASVPARAASALAAASAASASKAP